jgi:hypothetical protein
VEHGFTVWDGDAYNQRADVRSWDQTISAMYDLMPVSVTGETFTSNGDNNEKGDTDTNGGGSSSTAEKSGAVTRVRWMHTILTVLVASVLMVSLLL